MSIVKIARRSYKPGDIVPSRRKLSNYSENKRSHCTVMFSEGTKGCCAYIENFTGSGKNQSDKLSSTKEDDSMLTSRMAKSFSQRDLVLNPIKNDLVSKVNIWSQNDNKFNLVKGKFGSERTKKSDDWNASEKTKNSDSENLKKILKNETFHSKVLKRNCKLNELKEDSHFCSNKEFRNIEEQSKFQGDSVHSSLKRNINQLHSKKIKIQTKFSHDFVALNTIEEECEIKCDNQDEEEINDIKKLRLTLENLETNPCIAQINSIRNNNLQNDSKEITLFLAFSTAGKD